MITQLPVSAPRLTVAQRFPEAQHQNSPLAAIAALALACVLVAAGCASAPPLRTAEYVDLERFAGDWFVIATIPTPFERNAYRAVESYSPPADGRIDTTFSFNRGGFDGERKTYRPTAFVRGDGSNAVWGMQFIWPFKAEYRIVHVDSAYQVTVIGRSKRDYAWIMARDAVLTPAAYAELVGILRDEGYDVDKLRRVPQVPDQRAPVAAG
ncbi:MAG: lipocalin family protein [Pseudomonadota bacterium]